MTHRDELLALKARVDALEQDLDETKAENELLRAAHARKTREVETLKRAIDDDESASFDPPAAPPPLRAAPSGAHHLRFVMLATGFALLGTMVMSAGMTAQAGRGPMASSRSMVSPLLRIGTVTESSGPALPAVGERCTVERIPVAAGAFDCRVEVRCGDQTLYGDDLRSGFVQCGGRELVRDENPTAFDGDPAMTLDLAHGVVTLEDRAGLSPQRVRIEL